ncbi:MAG: hypothetical protein U0271_29060 [Polyangiaceae bacterium]
MENWCSWVVVAASLTVACNGGGGGDGQSPEADVDEYDALEADLEQHREVFREGAAQDFAAAENTIFFIDASAGNPVLKSFDHGSNTETDYAFRPYLSGPNNPNPIDNLNFFASTSVIATMNELDGVNAYAPGQAEEHLGKLVLPAPPYGQSWWAYAVSGGQVYIAVLNEAGKLELQQWTPGAEASTTVAVFDDLIAPNPMGEFHTFAVSGSTLIFDEGGRIWVAELGDEKAAWVQNDQEVTGADFQSDAIVYSEDTEFWLYDRASDSRSNLSDRIRGNGYELNATFAEAHYPDTDCHWSRRGSMIYYEANFGIFAYDLDADTVTPILLSARDNSTVYRYPTVLADGTLFVKGLESSSGSVGADGPTYMLTP